MAKRPTLVLTQGDPTGVGPEIALKLLRDTTRRSLLQRFQPLLVCEHSALEALRTVVSGVPWERLRFLDREPDRACLEGASDALLVYDPSDREGPRSSRREIHFGRPGEADARSALRALDLGIRLARDGVVDALVTLPVHKLSIASHVDGSFRGHTDYIAQRCGLERYGRDYLMAFLAPGLRVALLNTHLPLRAALESIAVESVCDALLCLARHTQGHIALAGLNPHAGEGGLLGTEEERLLVPAIERARAQGARITGPLSPDTVFARALEGEFDWVLALYHDQGLIAVKTAAFGRSTNWTLGLPFLRTSVDHGTAHDIAGRGVADEGPLRAVVETTLELIAERRVR